MVQSDYIILGAGVAGCTLASEIDRRQLGSVLVIEAGSLPTSRALKIPSEYPKAFGSQFDWGFRTVPQKHLAGRRLSLPAGRTLGGSSSLNAMIFLPGHPDDYRRWEQILGTDWGYEQVEVIFQEIEHRVGGLELAAPDLSPSVAHTLDRLANLLPRHDLLRRPEHGVGAYLRCQCNGRRVPSWRLWFPEADLNQQSDGTIALSRNVHVWLHQTVRQVWIHQDRAMGVLLEEGAKIHATKGVIVACGALSTPVLLMRSGIGEKTELEAAGVEMRVASPYVGKNLSDHLILPIVWSTNMEEAFDPGSRKARTQYVRARQGQRASNIAEAGGFFGTERASEPPQFQWHITPTHYLEYPFRNSHQPSISIGVTPLRPQSRGTVRISRNAIAAEASELTVDIDPRYLSDPSDMQQFLSALERTRRTIEHCNLRDFLLEEVLPGSKRQDDDSLTRVIARFATTLYHYAGTCAMGPDNYDVLDSRFRVRGVQGLWVCDASAMPTNVSANTQATVMMLAMRLATWLT